MIKVVFVNNNSKQAKEAISKLKKITEMNIVEVNNVTRNTKIHGDMVFVPSDRMGIDACKALSVSPSHGTSVHMYGGDKKFLRMARVWESGIVPINIDRL